SCAMRVTIAGVLGAEFVGLHDVDRPSVWDPTKGCAICPARVISVTRSRLTGPGLDPASLLPQLRARAARMTDDLRLLVEAESSSADIPATGSCLDLVAELAHERIGPPGADTDGMTT